MWFRPFKNIPTQSLLAAREAGIARWQEAAAANRTTHADDARKEIDKLTRELRKRNVKLDTTQH
jgi:hypothetical protein